MRYHVRALSICATLLIAAISARGSTLTLQLPTAQSTQTGPTVPSLVTPRRLVPRDPWRWSKTLQMRYPGTIARRILRVRESALLKYRHFSPYCDVRLTSVMGTELETILVGCLNKGLKASDAPRRGILTHAEGAVHSPADVIEVSRSGTPVGKYQCKLGYRQSLKALSEPRYADQMIFTTRESHDMLMERLEKLRRGAAKNRAAVRPETWAEIRAIETRVLHACPDGSPLPTRSELGVRARVSIGRMWNAAVERLAREAPERLRALGIVKTPLSSRSAVAASMQINNLPARASASSTLRYFATRKWALSVASRFLRVAKVAGKSLPLVGFAVSATDYAVHLGKWRHGGTSDRMLQLKSTALALEAASLPLLYAPEGLFTKLAGIVLLVGGASVEVAVFLVERTNEVVLTSIARLNRDDRQFLAVEQIQNLQSELHLSLTR